MLSGGLQPPAGDQARLAPPASGAQGLEKPQDRWAAAASPPSAQAFSFPIWARDVLFKVAGFCLFALSRFSSSSSSLCRVYIFPKHVPSALHRRYTFLEEMLQSHRVSGVFSLIGIG